jgi:RNA polymerase sigma-70 factor (ECF subfamily)
LQRADVDKIENLQAWLTTVTGRLALDALGTARARREQYVGSWLPEPDVAEWVDPADRITQDERVTMALLVVLESLSPAERTAFVLQDIFGMSSKEAADVVGRTPAAVRQLASRARRHVEDGTPRFPASADEQSQIVDAFAVAWRAGDMEALLRILDSDVTFTADGGGKVTAVPRPMHGAEHVARLLLSFVSVARSRNLSMEAQAVLVNGRPGLILSADNTPSVYSFTIDNGRIVSIDVIRNPDKLTRLRRS